MWIKGGRRSDRGLVGDRYGLPVVLADPPACAVLTAARPQRGQDRDGATRRCRPMSPTGTRRAGDWAAMTAAGTDDQGDPVPPRRSDNRGTRTKQVKFWVTPAEYDAFLAAIPTRRSDFLRAAILAAIADQAAHQTPDADQASGTTEQQDREATAA